MDPSQKVAGIKLLTTATTTWRGGHERVGTGTLGRGGEKTREVEGEKEDIGDKKGENWAWRVARGERSRGRGSVEIGRRGGMVG